MIIWFAGFLMLIVGYGAAFPESYATQADIDIMAVSLDSPMMATMVGPIYAADGIFTNGSLYAALMFVWSALGMAVMNILHVVRHTRQDEELGRIEVIRSLPTGRLANLSSALSSAFILNAVFALVLGLGLGALGVEGMDMTGSVLFGVALGAAGMVFAAVTAVFCQLTANPRTAQGYAWVFLVAAFMIRAMGDLQENEVLSCISPFGLLTRSRFFSENLWWPVLITLIVTIIATLAALRLCASRDMGAGLIAAKPGRADARPSLSSPGGLARRLLRPAIITWIVLMFGIAYSYGSITGDLEAFIESNEMFNVMAGGDADTPGDPMMFISTLIVMMMSMGAMPVLHFVLKARSQEKGGFAENVLVRAASRDAQLGGYFVIALISCVLVPLLSALGLYAASSPIMAEPISIDKLLLACMVYVPSMLLTLGVAVMLIGFLPRHASLAWAYLGYGFIAMFLGGLLRLPEWVGYLSPLAFTPMLPYVEQVGQGATYELTSGDVTALIVMTVLSIVMYVLGFIGHRNRDMVFAQ